MTDRRERLNDPTIASLVALEGLQSTIWTQIPVKVVSVARLVSENTVDLQPTIMGKYRAPGAQKYTDLKLPVLLQCPVHFGAGSAFFLTFPLAVGDEGLVLLSARCIDAWFASGADHNVQAELRMHDLSDGFFLPGFRSRPNRIQGLSMTDVQLRNAAGDTFISIKPSKDITVTTPGNIDAMAGGHADVTATTIKLTGQVTVDGDLIVTGQSNLEALDVAGIANFHDQLIDERTGKDIGGAHEHDHGTMTGSGHTGAVI